MQTQEIKPKAYDDDEESIMEPTTVNTVWINPPKYWAATNGMSDDQKTQLLEEVERLVLDGDTSSLRKYDFVELNPLAQKAN